MALKRRSPQHGHLKPVATPLKKIPDPVSLYAALDLGTNSCRMLVAQPKGNHIHVIDGLSRPVQFGRDLERSGRLSRSGIGRAISALKISRSKLERHNVKSARFVATEACRRAANGARFIRDVERITGLKLEIITAEEEARLAVISCASLVSKRTEQLLVVDIGGGSTELVWIDLSKVPMEERSRALMRLSPGLRQSDALPFASPHVVDWISVPLGVATLREQFCDVSDDRARYALMSCFFEEQLEDFIPYAHGFLDSEKRESFQIIGTSGTVTTVAASHLGLRRYDRTKVDGLRMNSEQISRVIEGYLDLGPAGRLADPRIGRDRQSLIMSGSAILQALMRLWPTNRLTVADRGLREGLLFSQMHADGALQDGIY